MYLAIEEITDPAGQSPQEFSADPVEVQYSTAHGFRLAPPAATQSVNVTIFLNETEGHRFTEYHATDHLRRAWEGQISFHEGTSDEVMLETVFRIFNVEHPLDYRDRSLSMADVVVLDGLRRYAVARFGFERLADFWMLPTWGEVMAWKRRRFQANQSASTHDYFRERHACARCCGSGLAIPFFADTTVGESCCQQFGGSGGYHESPVYVIVPRSDDGDGLLILLKGLAATTRESLNSAKYLAARLEEIGLKEDDLFYARHLLSERVLQHISSGLLLYEAPSAARKPLIYDYRAECTDEGQNPWAVIATNRWTSHRATMGHSHGEALRIASITNHHFFHHALSGPQPDCLLCRQGRWKSGASPSPLQELVSLDRCAGCGQLHYVGAEGHTFIAPTREFSPDREGGER